MEIQTNADALKALLGVSSPASPRSRHLENTVTATQLSLAGDRATLSEVGSQVAQVVDRSGIRAEKVAAIQQALTSGTYNVPASAVADKVMNAMRSRGAQAGFPAQGTADGVENLDPQ